MFVYNELIGYFSYDECGDVDDVDKEDIVKSKEIGIGSDRSWG